MTFIELSLAVISQQISMLSKKFSRFVPQLQETPRDRGTCVSQRCVGWKIWLTLITLNVSRPGMESFTR